MAFSKKNNEESNWMSVSDMMTGLMVIFMFVAIAFMIDVNKKKAQRDLIFEEFKATEEELYSELEKEFKDDLKKWNVVLDKDLSIKFVNPDILFATGDHRLSDKFKEILKDFLPRYFKMILKDEYKGRISEIRIEGHTDTKSSYNFDKDSYLSNMILSQRRAVAVLRFFKKSFPQYYKNNEKELSYLVTANGLSYGRTLDEDKKLTYETGKKENKKYSRRVEFRIVTNSKKVVKEAIEQINK